MFEKALNTISDGLASIGGVFRPGSNTKDSESFKIVGQDWYKVYGYQFVIKETSDPETTKAKGGFLSSIRNFGSSLASAATSAFSSDSSKQNTAVTDDEKTLYYALPIPPQSLVIKPLIASEVTPTLGGVVEETSENVMWIINLQGTTGIAVTRNIESGKPDRKNVAKQFRDTISTTGLLAGVTGQLNSAIAKFGGVADSAIDSFRSFAEGDIAGGIGNAVNAVNTATLPPLPYAGSAISEKSNGFTEIQELARFFDLYNKRKHKEPKKFQLLFRMHKTNQQWNCIVSDFSVQKSAQSPNLWKYNITLKAWNMQVTTVNSSDSKAFDRFGSGGDLKSVNTVGLQGLANLGKVYQKGGFGFKF